MGTTSYQDDFLLEIAKGAFPGRVVEYLGIGFAIDPHSTQGVEIVWNANTPYPTSPLVGKVSLTSTSGNDTGTGTGARTVEIHGTDAGNSQFITETVTMTGTTPAITANDFSSVSGLSRIKTAGSLGISAGLISGKMGGIEVLRIEVGFNSGSHSFLTVPLDTVVFLLGLNYSSRFPAEFITQEKEPILDSVFNDIDRVTTGSLPLSVIDLARVPKLLQPGTKLRTIVRSPYYFNKFRTSWRVALLKAVDL